MKRKGPDFLFVGTAKAGTTSLYHYLNQHPRISIPTKETFFFLREIYKDNSLAYPKQRNEQEFILDEEEYFSLYDVNSDSLLGEIGTGYLYHHEKSIPLIKEHLGENVKILIILRHPTDRTYSSYLHFFKDLHERGSFEEALEWEEKRVREGWDFMWHFKRVSAYAKQVAAFQKSFPQVKVLFHEELKADPQKVLNDVFSFLELDPIEDFQDLKHFNPSGEPRFKRLQGFITRENALKKALRPVIRMTLNQEKREKLRKGIKNRNLKGSPPINPDTRVELDRYFSSDIAELERLLGKPIEVWKRG